MVLLIRTLLRYQSSELSIRNPFASLSRFRVEKRIGPPLSSHSFLWQRKMEPGKCEGCFSLQADTKLKFGTKCFLFILFFAVLVNLKFYHVPQNL